MNISAWVGLAVLWMVVCLALLSLRLRRRTDPEQQARRRAVREQETINLARQQWMDGGG